MWWCRCGRSGERVAVKGRKKTLKTEAGIRTGFTEFQNCRIMTIQTLTDREALRAWKEARPPAPEPVKKRRTSKAFQAWRDYCEANGRCGFREFLTHRWPEVKRMEWY